MGAVTCQPWYEKRARGEDSSCQKAGGELLLLPVSACVAVAAGPDKHSAPLAVFLLRSRQVKCKLGKKMGERVHSHVTYLGRGEAIWKLKLCQDDSLEILL